ncbi:hypothetical protein ACFL6C_04435 [Myxococcota bacterium]
MADDENKVPYSDVLSSVSAELFAAIFSASSRKARETYFHRHGVRSSSKVRFSKPGAKTEARIAQLYEVLKTEEDDEMAEEMLRTWLLTKRPMLSAALDHLGIEHDSGLTESDDINKFEKLGKKEVRNIVEKLADHASREEIAVYLRFMGVKDVDKKLG